MSFAAFERYLRTNYLSRTTGRPLTKEAASDYPSRLRTLARLLDLDIENATPAHLREISESLGTIDQAKSLTDKARSDTGVSLRAYAAYLEQSDQAIDTVNVPTTAAGSRVYVANFGVGNALWPQCLAEGVLASYDDVVVHDFWKSGDREGYVATSMAKTKTALGIPPTRATAGRWFNLIQELRDTDGDLWISRQGDSIWWTRSLDGSLQESLQVLGGQQVWILKKPCQAWSDKDRAGRPLRWSALHPKARDFLVTEATFQTLSNERGYAGYARALISGGALENWHASPIFAAKAADSRKSAGRVFSSKELAAARMSQMVLDTVSGANGQVVERRVKEKVTSLSKPEWEALIREMMGLQEDRCKLTGLPLGYDKECDDKELLASLDRIDSSGHYTPDNVQLVCRFMNRWKGADDDGLTRRLIGLLQSVEQAS